MTDAHNHLQDSRFDDVRKDVIAEMLQSGVKKCVVNGTSPDDWEKVASLASEYPDLIIPSFGLHPWKAPTDDWYDLLLHYLDTTANACIGECGLDRWIDDYDIEEQTETFIQQLDLATERNLPLSIHCLKAWGALLDILESRPLPERGFLLHSYGGSAELVPRLAKLGAYFSISGYFLHPRKRKVIEAFQQVPRDRLFIETDAPDMLPPEHLITHPLKGEVNHPANIAALYLEFSKHLDTSQVKGNFSRFFKSD
ncbi:TatD family hydrolase [Akkermansiaceae bacterium]|nr:TatD family hydrolase [Akkermansiaceae bacterium]